MITVEDQCARQGRRCTAAMQHPAYDTARHHRLMQHDFRGPDPPACGFRQCQTWVAELVEPGSQLDGRRTLTGQTARASSAVGAASAACGSRARAPPARPRTAERGCTAQAQLRVSTRDEARLRESTWAFRQQCSTAGCASRCTGLAVPECRDRASRTLHLIFILWAVHDRVVGVPGVNSLLSHRSGPAS